MLSSRLDNVDYLTEKDNVYTFWYYPLFQSLDHDIGAYRPRIVGDYCLFILCFLTNGKKQHVCSFSVDLQYKNKIDNIIISRMITSVQSSCREMAFGSIRDNGKEKKRKKKTKTKKKKQ